MTSIDVAGALKALRSDSLGEGLYQEILEINRENPKSIPIEDYIYQVLEENENV